jgi:hypothetical protein
MIQETTFRMTSELGIPALAITGKIGPGELQDFQEHLNQLCAQGTGCVIVNMLLCPYLPSMGIPPLIHSDRHLTERGMKLLIAAHGDLLDIFRVLRLDKKLLILDSLDECVRSALVIAS